VADGALEHVRQWEKREGDIIEPDHGLIAIGSGGPYALAAAQALLSFTKISAQKVALEALKIAGEICIYTNSAITVETL
jgi:ATP-dependent HslUV protease subunit HslV